MAVGNAHRILSEVATLYARHVWSCWAVAVEAVGLTDRNYDVIAIKTSPRSIVAFETKASRKDFLSGIRDGQFNKSPYINELWLVYPGDFDVKELPLYVGILKPRPYPICREHEALRKPEACGDKCKRPKVVFLEEERRARYFWDKNLTEKYWHTYVPKWLWRIAVSNSTKYLNIIAANIVPGYEFIKENGSDAKEQNDGGNRSKGKTNRARPTSNDA